MKSVVRIVLLGAASLVAIACWLLPERYAVNAPIRAFARNLPDRGDAAPPPQLAAPEGFEITLFASDLPNARTLRFTPGGRLLLSQPREGRVVALEPDRDGDGRSDGRTVLLDGLDRPYGLDFDAQWLYLSDAASVARFPFDPQGARLLGAAETLLDGLPSGGNHWTRTLRRGPDNWLYLSIGSSCNVCIEADERRAAILRLRPDGSGVEIYARGLRNAVGFDWRPGSDEFYATDNGRDLLGDDFPPCELNRIERGGFYGWPHANGARVPDPDFGEGRADVIARSLPPAHAFRAHNAPLGIHFVRHPAAPPGYRAAALVALHGSWNRTRKDGYKVVSLHWQPDGRIEERDFLTGFESNEDVIGRPVDVAEDSEGAFYVSDDFAGAIYRIAPVAERRSLDSAAADALPSTPPSR